MFVPRLDNLPDIHYKFNRWTVTNPVVSSRIIMYDAVIDRFIYINIDFTYMKKK